MFTYHCSHFHRKAKQTESKALPPGGALGLPLAASASPNLRPSATEALVQGPVGSRHPVKQGDTVFSSRAPTLQSLVLEQRVPSPLVFPSPLGLGSGEPTELSGSNLFSWGPLGGQHTAPGPG